MKKIFISVCLLGLFAPSSHAYNHTIPMECAVTVEEGEKLPLQVKKNEKEIGHGVPEPKTLTIIPKVTKQNKTLHFITPCNGCTFRLLQDDNICHEVEITGSTLTIPNIFTGIYELQIVSEEHIFYTEIELY